MNMASSAQYCSSGCESGWTLYLQHSTPSKFNGGFGFYDDKYNNHMSRREKIACDADHDSRYYDHDDEDEEEEEEEEEDLSMVSDASSGPPHFHHLDDDHDKEEMVFGGNASKRKKQSINIKLGRPNSKCDDHDFALDDTASSPIIFASKKNRGIDDVGNQGCSSLESLIDYSSQGFSTTHFQGRSTHFQQPYGFLQSPAYSTLQFQHNQW